MKKHKMKSAAPISAIVHPIVAARAAKQPSMAAPRAASAQTLDGKGISINGIMLIKAFEGLSLNAYQDEAGVWTIGYGHTGLQHNDGTVFAGRIITQTTADALLIYDLQQFEARVRALIKVPLTQEQFDALVSFDFNTGGLTLGLAPSTLNRLLNGNDYFGAAGQFDAWNHINGQVFAGLTRRRHAERDLFCGFGWQRWNG